uniref:Uncharacterized protein n=1 Tax=Octactis speculum TaxID=3111310 RepID=A0A7S2HF58_9STRA|mmetsp:Transcript_64355/g.88383  ORF Transcript_64355/g.88383 Transcript_64355/m.88383 type:complete len:410 (+) Transcript_64355:242-1471(+)|eukprot:CAMPEP_0185756890 /NCGR_PEP_ID=MMETSP1174-20130828/15273_1 /TAXON_ID=35687 /ORGANISM="Dictyocha speculum, Strain CCMP1381" /LENGTH=409 /DNA_ID=CAMNT_0028436033 /DNA_START=229 /DNA_END=1458 /DNA_ORIENTATION=+
MPSKKRKGKGKKGTKGLTGDAQEHQFQRKLSEANKALVEERKAREKLARDKASLLQRLSLLEQRLLSLRATNSAEVMNLESESMQARTRASQTLEDLKAKKLEFEKNLKMVVVTQKENLRLEKRIRETKMSMVAEQAVHRRTEEEQKKEAFNTRMNFESYSRQTLRKLHEEYEQRAVREMELESTNAHLNKHRLSAKLSDRTALVSDVMQRHMSQGKKFSTVRLDHEILTAEKTAQSQYLKDLEGATQGHRALIDDARAALLELKKEVRALHVQNLQRKVLESEVQKSMNRLTSSRVQAQNYKTQAYQISRQLLRRGRGAATASSIGARTLTHHFAHDRPQRDSMRMTDNLEEAAETTREQHQYSSRERPEQDLVGAEPRSAAEEEMAIWSKDHTTNASIVWVTRPSTS